MRALRRRSGPLWAGLPALAGAVAALMVPGASQAATAEATTLAVGALALFAGHSWGLLVIVASHIPLVGRVWPVLVRHGPGGPAPGGDVGAAAIAVVIVTALPAIVFAALLLPRAVAELFAHKSPGTRAIYVSGAALLLAASLVLPAL